jgi:3-oxoacyl-[acyl-carrier protein] reductase
MRQKKNIYVNAIAPGIIATDQTYEQFKSGAAKKIIDSTQLIKRPGELKDLNSAINFLVDKNQTYMTGQIIALSGGAIIDN